MKIANQQDFWSGIMFTAFGALAIVVARDYPLGSTLRMGPGYFPTALGAIMLVIGTILAVRGLRAPGERIDRWGWRPLLWLAAAFAAFGALMESAGFVLALLALIVCSAVAGRDSRCIELAVLIVVLIAGSVALFVYGLELPYRLFPWS